MDHIPVEGGHLEGWESGSGEPIVLIHGSGISDEWECIVREPALAGYRVIRYRRRGYGGSVAHTGPFSISQQAGDVQAVLRHFGLDRAHIVGHSYGASTSLQLALESPDSIHSLALLEPPIPVLPSAVALAELMAPAFATYMAGDRATTFTTLIDGLGGATVRQAIDKTLPPDWFDRGVADIGTGLEIEGTALGTWSITAEQLGLITLPCLAVVGADSLEWFQHGHRWLSQHLPDVELFSLPAAGHMLHMIDPRSVAIALGAFVGRHPM